MCLQILLQRSQTCIVGGFARSVTHFRADTDWNLQGIPFVGDGVSAAFKLEQDRIVFQILGEYRETIREMQINFLSAMENYRGHTSILLSNTIDFISKDVRHCMEVSALYNAVQHPMTGNIPHFLLPHQTPTNAINTVKSHLDKDQPQFMLARQDHSYYYSEATFNTFRKNDVLFLVVKAPIRMRSLVAPLHFYNIIKLPMITLLKQDFHSRLATNIKLAFSRDADYIKQISENDKIPLATQ